jgi:hypothetical protein
MASLARASQCERTSRIRFSAQALQNRRSWTQQSDESRTPTQQFPDE